MCSKSPPAHLTLKRLMGKEAKSIYIKKLLCAAEIWNSSLKEKRLHPQTVVVETTY